MKALRAAAERAICRISIAGRRRRERAPKPDNPLPFSRGIPPSAPKRPQPERARGAGDDGEAERASRRSRSRRSRWRACCRPRTPASGARRRRRVRRRARSATRCGTWSATCRTRRSTTRRAAPTDPGATIQFDTKGVEFGPWLRRFVAQVRRNWFVPLRGDDVPRPRGAAVQHPQGRHDHRRGRRAARRTSTRSTARPTTRSSARIRPSRCRRSIPSRSRSSPSRSTTTNSRRCAERRAWSAMPTRTQQLGLLIVLAALVVYVFIASRAVDRVESLNRSSSPCSGRPRPARARWASRWPSATAARSSTAIRRPSIAASTSAPTSCRSTEQRGIPHHLIDIADPTEVYTAAQFARDADASFATFTPAGRLPILVGGTGFYYRALTRGLFPGPGADEALRARLDRVAARQGARAPAPDAAARRSRLGRAHHAARPEAAGAGARGLLLDRPAADRALRRHALADRRLRGHRRRAADSGRR